MAAELRDYVSSWLETIRPTVRRNTLRAYEQSLRCRALPYLGQTPIDQITRTQLKGWFAQMLAKYKPGTAAHALVTLHTVLSAALEDELIPRNPAASLRRVMRTMFREKQQSHRPPMTKEQLTAFLEAAQYDHETYPQVCLLAFTGMRIGEAVGLQWEDVDFHRRTIHIQRQVYEYGEVGQLKSGAGLRTIDMADRLARVLWAVKVTREAEEAKYNVPGAPWVLFPDLLKGLTARQARLSISGAVKTALKRAGLPSTFSCHSLRHTIATALVEDGTPLKYVQRMLGHASITITADRYAKTANMTDQGVVERFATALAGGPTVPKDSA